MTNYQTTGRNPYPDMVRGIGILLVIIGHSGIPAKLWQLIYGFHMPLFFMLSGYLYQKEKWDTSNFYIFLKQKWNAYMIPYFILAAINFLLYIPIAMIGEQQYSEQELIIHLISKLYYIVYGSLTGTVTWGSLWFLPCLFLGSLYFF